MKGPFPRNQKIINPNTSSNRYNSLHFFFKASCSLAYNIAKSRAESGKTESEMKSFTPACTNNVEFADLALELRIIIKQRTSGMKRSN